MVCVLEAVRCGICWCQKDHSKDRAQIPAKTRGTAEAPIKKLLLPFKQNLVQLFRATRVFQSLCAGLLATCFREQIRIFNSLLSTIPLSPRSHSCLRCWSCNACNHVAYRAQSHPSLRNLHKLQLLLRGRKQSKL